MATYYEHLFNVFRSFQTDNPLIRVKVGCHVKAGVIPPKTTKYLQPFVARFFHDYKLTFFTMRLYSLISALHFILFHFMGRFYVWGIKRGQMEFAVA